MIINGRWRNVDVTIKNVNGLVNRVNETLKNVNKTFNNALMEFFKNVNIHHKTLSFNHSQILMVLEPYILKVVQGRKTRGLVSISLQLVYLSMVGLIWAFFFFPICVVGVLVYLMEVPPIKRYVLPSSFPSPMTLIEALQHITLS